MINAESIVEEFKKSGKPAAVVSLYLGFELVARFGMINKQAVTGSGKPSAWLKRVMAEYSRADVFILK